MCRLRNIAICEYQESVTTGHTHTHTHRRRTKWCRYASQATQKGVRSCIIGLVYLYSVYTNYFMTHRSFSVILSSHTGIGNFSQVRLHLHRSWPTDRCNWHRLMYFSHIRKDHKASPWKTPRGDEYECWVGNRWVWDLKSVSDSADRSTILQIELPNAPGLRLTNRLSPFKGGGDFRTSRKLGWPVSWIVQNWSKMCSYLLVWTGTEKKSTVVVLIKCCSNEK